MEPFKNLFSVPNARKIAAALRRGMPGFSEERLLLNLESELNARALKARMLLIAARIEAQLPRDPEQSFPILVAALSQRAGAAMEEQDEHVRARQSSHADAGQAVDGLHGFLVWPLTEIVARRGLDHFELSMRTLREMTIRFTAEFAIRPFLKNARAATLERMLEWTQDANEHVRRLASEGSRPLLPWGERLPVLQQDPEATLAILENLKNDPSEYVRRSVANHLNDHSKAHPDWVVTVLAGWSAEEPDALEMRRLIRHASRGLLKQGHPGALALHGLAAGNKLDVTNAILSSASARVGETLAYAVTVRNRSTQPAKVMFDYAIHHLKANGRTTPKVFKGRSKTLAAGESWQIGGAHPIRKITTRRYYPGVHFFEPRVNGMEGPRLPFELTA